jgi:autotransporter-associated beta strand protein
MLRLDGDNTYSGATTVSGGTLLIAGAEALSSGSSGAAVDAGASLALSGGLTFAAVPLTLDGAGGGTPALVNHDGSNTYTGAITLATAGVPITVSAGTLDLSGNLGDGGSTIALIENGPGTLQLGGSNTYGGGTTVASGTLDVTSSGATGISGVVEVQGGATLQVSAATYDLPSGGLKLDASSSLAGSGGSADTVVGGITLAGAATIDIGSTGSLTLPGVIGGGYGLTTGGAGTLILTGTSNYTGATTVSAGVLEVDGSIAASSGVTLDSGATLSGGGSVPSVTADGTIQPGSTASPTSTGTLIVAGGTLNADSTVGIRLDGTTPGSDYDQISVGASGTLALDGPALGLSLGSGYSPTLGTSYTIVSMGTSATHSGTFDRQGQSLTDGSTFVIGNTVFRINYNGGSGNITVTAMMHIDTWTGGGSDDHWSTARNWQAGVAPVAGDELIFPQGSAAATDNDFASGTEFNSITIGDPGYTFAGSPIALDEGITATYASGTSSFPLDVTLKAGQTFSVGGARWTSRASSTTAAPAPDLP